MVVDILGNNRCTITTKDGTYLQSYKTVVAFRGPNGITLYPKWDYSRTTAKHVSQFLGIPTKEIRKQIKTGKIAVLATNVDSALYELLC